MNFQKNKFQNNKFNNKFNKPTPREFKVVVHNLGKNPNKTDYLLELGKLQKNIIDPEDILGYQMVYDINDHTAYCGIKFSSKFADAIHGLINFVTVNKDGNKIVPSIIECNTAISSKYHGYKSNDDFSFVFFMKYNFDPSYWFIKSYIPRKLFVLFLRQTFKSSKFDEQQLEFIDDEEYDTNDSAEPIIDEHKQVSTAENETVNIDKNIQNGNKKIKITHSTTKVHKNETIVDETKDNKTEIICDENKEQKINETVKINSETNNIINSIDIVCDVSNIPHVINLPKNLYANKKSPISWVDIIDEEEEENNKTIKTLVIETKDKNSSSSDNQSQNDISNVNNSVTIDKVIEQLCKNGLVEQIVNTVSAIIANKILSQILPK